MSSIVVQTKEELKKAKNDKIDEIIVVGKLAKDLKAAKKITTLSTGALAALTAFVAGGVATAPFTGGTSMVFSAVAVAPIAVTTGLSVPAIILIAVLGVGFVTTLFKEYDIEIDIRNQTIRLLRKEKSK